MTKYSIYEVGEKANKNRDSLDFEKWLERTLKYITEKIDPAFSREKFAEWLEEDDEKPFISGKNRYYW